MTNLLRQTPIYYGERRKNWFIMRFSEDLDTIGLDIETDGFPKYTSCAEKMSKVYKNTVNCSYRGSWSSINVKLPNSYTNDRFIEYNVTFIRFKEWIEYDHLEKDVFIDLLDTFGVSVCRWLLQDCVILSHTNKNGEINLTIQPDRCLLLY